MKMKTLTVRSLLVGLVCALAEGALETACAPKPADTKATEAAPAQTAAPEPEQMAGVNRPARWLTRQHRT